MDPISIALRLAASVDALHFAPPVTHVYNPLDYANAPHRVYAQRFGAAPREVMLIGMNPGPFGMAQTGAPFGDKTMVRDWMGIEAPVGKPPVEHPKRPILGFACPRGEVSGARLWGWARDRFGAPERFFARFYVHNYCPLCFMEASGRNFTPDKLPAAERDALFAACDAALRDLTAYFGPTHVIGVGGFAEQRIRAALPDFKGVIGRIPHPSPASPAANRGWAPAAEQALRELGVAL
jgi:single-strand selective monofunctional uracil DNA glycosylase